MKCSVGVIGALPSFRTNIWLSLLFAAFCIKHPVFCLQSSVCSLLYHGKPGLLSLFACRCMQHISLCHCMPMDDHFSIELFTFLTFLMVLYYVCCQLCQLYVKSIDYSQLELMELIALYDFCWDLHGGMKQSNMSLSMQDLLLWMGRVRSRVWSSGREQLNTPIVRTNAVYVSCACSADYFACPEY